MSSGQTTVRELVENIAASAEHRQRFLPGESEGSRRNAVTNLYRHLLGREPDAGGLQAHVDLRGAQRHRRGDRQPDQLGGVSAEVRRERRARAERPLLRRQYDSSGNNNLFRFRNMDRNGNNHIERNEWNGSTAVVQHARLEP